MVFKWFFNGFLNGLFESLIVGSSTSNRLHRFKYRFKQVKLLRKAEFKSSSLRILCSGVQSPSSPKGQRSERSLSRRGRTIGCMKDCPKIRYRKSTRPAPLYQPLSTRAKSVHTQTKNTSRHPSPREKIAPTPALRRPEYTF